MRLVVSLFFLFLFGIAFNVMLLENKRTTYNALLSPKIRLKEQSTSSLQRLRQRSSVVRKFLVDKKMSSDLCFFADMSMASGRPRFFVFDLEHDSLLLSGLVTHGSGRVSGRAIQYSNEPGSLCTSLGRYQVGKPYRGKFGLAYKLKGLDESNNNALKRFVVLHSHECVPENDVWPEKICMSWGCPTVSPGFLNKLASYIEQEEKPILLWMFN